MEVLNIVKGNREPMSPYAGGHMLALIIYDTLMVDEIKQREERQLRREPDSEVTFELKGKYALCWVGRGDTDLIAQMYATRKHSSKAIWTDRWSELIGGIQKLRDLHPDAEIPENIEYVIDWCRIKD